VPPPDVLRRLRTVRVLEQIGSPEAGRLLEALAKGAPVAAETGAVGAALERLSRRSAAR
jgi:hypothetical protein